MKGEAAEVRDASPGYAPQVEMPVVPESYKQTEVGVIPEEWEVRTLGEVSTFLDGQRRPVKASDRAKMSGTIPYYGASGVVDYINDYLFDEELILLGEDGENILSRNLRLAFRISGKSWVNNHAHVIRPNSDISIGFLTEYLESLDYSGLNSGTAQPKLNKQKCLAIHVAVPPIVEQRAIATALSDVDALLEALDRLITKKRDIKQATMQQLLTGQTRLPGFEGEWEVQRLGEFAPLQRGFDLPTTQIKSGKYPVVYSNGILNYHECYQVKGPGVVTGRSGTIGRVTFVSDHYWPHNTSLWVTNFKGNDPKFVFYLYSRLNFERFSSGSGVPTLNRNDLHALDIFIPNELEEQVAISTVLSDIDAEIQALHQRRTKTAALKQAMMQELLTGRTRLVAPQAVAEAGA